MKIVNRPKIILTDQEAAAFNDIIRLLESITTSPEIRLSADLIKWTSEARNLLESIWQDDTIDVE